MTRSRKRFGAQRTALTCFLTIASACFSDVATGAARSCGQPKPIAPAFVVEAESTKDVHILMPRCGASDESTVLLLPGEKLKLTATVLTAKTYQVSVRYSNDGPGTPPESVAVSIDGKRVGPPFLAGNTKRPSSESGAGWNVFVTSPPLGRARLTRGDHDLALAVSQGDKYGVEIDEIVFS